MKHSVFDDEFKRMAVELSRLKGSLKNGLSTDENLRLFTTPHQSEIIYLIFKGLNKLEINNK